MANNRDLNFDVGAIDRTAKALEKIALRLEKLDAKLEKLDGKKVEPKVDVDTKKATTKLRQLGDVTASATAGAIRVATSNIHILVGIAVAALLSLPAVGALAGVGIVFGFGAALAGVGLAAAAQTKKVKKQFADLKKDLGRDLRDAAEPFIGVFDTIDKQVRRVFKSLDLDTIFGRLAPGVDRFIKQLGTGFTKLAPALKPLTDAFNDILGELGPEMPALFAQIGKALSTLGRSVSENKDVLAGFVLVLLKTIPRVIEFVALLVRLFPKMLQAALTAFAVIAPAIANTVIPALRLLANVVLTVFGVIVKGAAKAFGWVPNIGPKLKAAAAGFDDFKADVIGALDTAQQKVNEWAGNAAKLSQEIKIRTDISQLETALRTAKRKLKDPDLTKPQKKAIRGDIEHLERKLAEARRKLRVLDPPTIKQIRGNIRDLHQKLESAKRQLRNPRLTRAQTKRLKGHIRDLENKIRRAKRAIASVHGKTVTIRARWSVQEFAAAARIRGVGLASGGPALSGRSFLVGERGPEILTMGSNSGTVIPNRQLDDGSLSGGDTIVHVYLGDHPVEQVVKRVVVERDRNVKRRALSGAGGAR